MNSYVGQKLRTIDKNLLKGIYIRKLKDFKEDYVTNFGSKSLFARLKHELLNVTEKKQKQVETKNDSNERKTTKKHKKEKTQGKTKIKALNSSDNSLDDTMRQLKISHIIDNQHDITSSNPSFIQNHYSISKKKDESAKNSSRRHPE